VRIIQQRQQAALVQQDRTLELIVSDRLLRSGILATSAAQTLLVRQQGIIGVRPITKDSSICRHIAAAALAIQRGMIL
jgi:inactivated superfamily I helicase